MAKILEAMNSPLATFPFRRAELWWIVLPLLTKLFLPLVFSGRDFANQNKDNHAILVLFKDPLSSAS